MLLLFFDYYSNNNIKVDYKYIYMYGVEFILFMLVLLLIDDICNNVLIIFGLLLNYCFPLFDCYLSSRY
jgi:hypothetical protein